MNSKGNEFYCIILKKKKEIKKEKQEGSLFPCDKFQILGRVLWRALGINWCRLFSLFHSSVINFNLASGNKSPELLYCIHIDFHGKTVCLSRKGKPLISSANTVMNNEESIKRDYFQKSIESQARILLRQVIWRYSHLQNQPIIE